jgi:zinc transport system substrate-binding protein
MRPGALTAAWLLLAGAAPGLAATAEPLRVAVSIPPQAYFVQRIGGPRVQVQVLIPPGVEEETYSPTPRQLAGLAAVQVYVEVGHPAFILETRYLLPFLRRHPKVQVVDMSAGIALLGCPPAAAGGSGKATPCAGAGTDPHIWIAPYTVKTAAENIAAGLARADPASREVYRAGLAAFLADLRGVDAELRRAVAGARGLEFIAYHPAWSYLAHQYGLVQIPVEVGGKEPGAASLAALAERARREKVKAVFMPAGFSPKGAETVARAIGGKVVTVDYLARDWLAAMHLLAAALAEARLLER